MDHVLERYGALPACLVTSLDVCIGGGKGRRLEVIEIIPSLWMSLFRQAVSDLRVSSGDSEALAEMLEKALPATRTRGSGLAACHGEPQGRDDLPTRARGGRMERSTSFTLSALPYSLQLLFPPRTCQTGSARRLSRRR